MGGGCSSNCLEEEDPQLSPLHTLTSQGKFIRINFDVAGYIVGANIETCILQGPEGAGWGRGARGSRGGRLLEYLTTYRKQASFPQGTPAPAAQKLCFSFPLCRMGRITEPWEGIETASAPGRRRAGASAAFIGRPAQPC